MENKFPTILYIIMVGNRSKFLWWEEMEEIHSVTEAILVCLDTHHLFRSE
jgi:hypothetical protein